MYPSTVVYAWTLFDPVPKTFVVFEAFTVHMVGFTKNNNEEPMNINKKFHKFFSQSQYIVIILIVAQP